MGKFTNIIVYKCYESNHGVYYIMQIRAICLVLFKRDASALKHARRYGERKFWFKSYFAIGKKCKRNFYY